MREESRARRMFRSGTSGCLAIPVGLILFGLLWTPLWVYWLLAVESSVVVGPTFLSLGAGAFYAVLFGAVVSVGLPVRWWVAIALAVLGVMIGLAFASSVRSAMLDGCLLGTGPQPDWCSERDSGHLAPIPYAYGIAGGMLGVFLYVAGAVGTRLQVLPDQFPRSRLGRGPVTSAPSRQDREKS